MIKKAVGSLVDKLVDILLDWIFTLIYGLFAGILKVVEFIESFFDVFAGTSKIMYNGESDFLLNIFFAHDAVTNAFWAMTLIAVVLLFGFCIFAVSRKITDVTGTVKHTLGQIFSQFFRGLLILVLLNVMVVASVNITNVLLDRINYAMTHAAHLDEDAEGREFTEQEYATMTKILATIGNYAANPSADSRYNLNSCFNAVRGDLQALQATGVFDYNYSDTTSWQSALSRLARSADLSRDLSLDVYNDTVSQAILYISDQLQNNPSFRPVERVTSAVGTSDALATDKIIFLIVGMEAANNKEFNNGDIEDSLRIGYVTGEKKYTDIDQVKEDFNIRKLDYFVGFIASIVFIIIMALCIFTFIVRMFNILLLYITAPLFVSSMPLDEGQKFQSWLQSFVIQLFSGFGHVIAMRLYLMIIPVVMGSDLVFFPGDGLWISTLNWFARLLMVLGGAWAVLKAGGLITAILGGNPGMHAGQQDAAMGAKVLMGARAAMHSTSDIAKGLGTAALHLPMTAQKVFTAPARAVNAAENWATGFRTPYSQMRRLGQRGGGSDKKASRQSAPAPKEPPAPPKPPYSPPPPAPPLSSDKAAGSAPSAPSASSFRVPDYPKPPPMDSWVDTGGRSRGSQDSDRSS